MPIFYDPMISKLIAWGDDRPQAIARMRRALGEYDVRRHPDNDPVLPRGCSISPNSSTREFSHELPTREVFHRTPWQRVYIAIFATYASEVAESYIIDVQHWRHFYLLIGVIWGLIAVRETRSRSAVAPAPDRLYIPTPQRSVAQPG